MNKNRDKITSMLVEADDMLGTTSAKTELFLVGGGAFILHNLIDRVTYDIDFINGVEDDVLSILEEHDINNRARIFDITFGEYKEDAVKIDLGLKNIDVWLVSKTRLLVSRLFSRKRYTDFINVFKNDDIAIDKNEFEMIFEDVWEYAQHIYMNELKENTQIIKDSYKMKGWDYENSRVKKLCEK